MSYLINSVGAFSIFKTDDGRFALHLRDLGSPAVAVGLTEEDAWCRAALALHEKLAAARAEAAKHKEAIEWSKNPSNCHGLADVYIKPIRALVAIADALEAGQ